eukprot:3541658-Rhodomonas_salina.1
MDFFRKGVQAAKNVAQQVKEAVDEREFTSGGMKGGASTDGDFNACVQHFVALNTSLKQVGTKAKEMMNSIKAQGQARPPPSPPCSLLRIFEEMSRHTSEATQLRSHRSVGAAGCADLHRAA